VKDDPKSPDKKEAAEQERKRFKSMNMKQRISTILQKVDFHEAIGPEVK
jgi:hypothetical protein